MQWFVNILPHLMLNHKQTRSYVINLNEIPFEGMESIGIDTDE